MFCSRCPTNCFKDNKNHQNLGRRIEKFQYYNFWKSQNFVKEENCTKHLSPVQWIIHLCIINFHLFLFIGNSTSWVNYSVRQNHNFMFVLIPYWLKKAALSNKFFAGVEDLGQPKLRAIFKIYLKLLIIIKGKY